MAEYDLEPGQMVGEYRVERKIGEGGFGKVYAAVHPVIGKAAAVKILNPQLAKNPDLVGRFVDEARAVNQIRHRNIIDIFAFGTLPGGLHYFVMELLDGTPLDAYLRKNAPLDPAHALSLLWPVGRALVAAHKAGITHRDLKPENVFLTMDHDGAIFPKLLDFGIAKLLHESEMASRTKTGAMMGTPYYMSPEQCRGSGVDQRSDIYSFGIMIHEVLTGRRPFLADSIVELLLKQVSDAPPPMSQVRPDLPRTLDAPVLRMLEKSADRRPQTMAAALDEIAAAARAAGIEVAASPQSSLAPQHARASQQPGLLAPTHPATPAHTPSTAGPPMDTAAWLSQGPPAASHAVGPPPHTAVPSQTPAHAPPVQHGTPAPPGVASGYGQSYLQAQPMQSAGVYPQPDAAQWGSAPGGSHHPAPHAPPQRSSSPIGIIAAIGAGVLFLMVVGTVLTFAVFIGSGGVQIRESAPPVGATIDRNVSGTLDMAFTAPGEAQPRVRAQILSHRQYRLTVQAVLGDHVQRAEITYADSWTTTKFGQENAETDRPPVSGKTYWVTAQGDSAVVQAPDGRPAPEAEEDEVLSDVEELFVPRSRTFADTFDVGEVVSLTSDETLAFLGAGAIDEGTTTRAEGAVIKLVSADGPRARFELSLKFVQDGGTPHTHIESPLEGMITLDTRSGLPLEIKLEGPLSGTVTGPDGTLAISGTMKLEGT
jgi:serine/threonine protein kinase